MAVVLDDRGEKLREELREFLRANHPGRAPRDRAERKKWVSAWVNLLADKNLAGPAWPREWGGMELSLSEQVAYHEEMTAARVPPQPPSLRIIGPTILRFGNEKQKKRYLPGMVRAAETWCLGYSEPSAGSDLPSLRTRAVRDGDEYVVNGQKLWTSNSMNAHMMAALVRTGSEESRQHGITYLLIPMDTPGIEVRPLKDMAHDVTFSEVFFTDVRVPVANVVGKENEGWTVARTALGYERSTANTSRDIEYRRIVNELQDLARSIGRSQDPLVRQELARLETTLRLLHLNNVRMLSAVLRGDDPGPESSITRLMHSTFEKRLHEFAIELIGANGMLGRQEPLACQSGRWAWGFLRTRASTIGAGTAEVQRNLIAERVLGLPHDPGMPSAGAADTAD